MISQRKQRGLHEAYLRHVLDQAGVPHRRTMQLKIWWLVRKLYRRS